MFGDALSSTSDRHREVQDMRLLMENTEHNVTDDGVFAPSHVKVFV